MCPSTKRRDAILLLGPTGAGKSPLGAALAEHGLGSRRCAHFDFGAHLRALAVGALAAVGLDEAAVAVARRALDTGALLDDDEFPIAAAILKHFVACEAPGARDLVVLDGLPRHVNQAADVDRWIRVIGVVQLQATEAVLRERIRRNTGGDRAGRVDDDEDRIAVRLARFAQRTRPVLDHYRALGRPVWTVQVGVETQADDARRALEALAGEAP